jgi:hypothetical protein
MEDNHARALNYKALVELKSALDASESSSDFLAEADAIIASADNVLELPLNLGSPEFLDAGSPNDTGRDVDNAPRVYEYLGALDRANASDRRLWTYLTFSTYREYMEKRWPLEDLRSWKGRVQDRWLMLNSSRGKLVRNGISRLWWVAALTHDPKMEHGLSKEAGNPFAYTAEAFRNEDRLNAIFDREAGALPDLVKAVLEHASQGGTYATDKHIQTLMKEMTLVYGYRDLSFLDIQALRELVATSAPPVDSTPAT